MAETQCKTAFCFAGWRAYVDGFDPETNNYGELVGLVKQDHPTPGQETVLDPRDGSIGRYAERRFQLDADEADELFAAPNSLEDLGRIVDRLCQQKHRTEQSKALLRETLHDVQVANTFGLWNQAEWVVLKNED